MGAWDRRREQGGHPLVEQDGREARRRVAVGEIQEEGMERQEEGHQWVGPILICS